MDINLTRATEQVERVLVARERAPRVEGFFDENTKTASYPVHDPMRSLPLPHGRRSDGIGGQIMLSQGRTADI